MRNTDGTGSFSFAEQAAGASKLGKLLEGQRGGLTNGALISCIDTIRLRLEWVSTARLFLMLRQDQLLIMQKDQIKRDMIQSYRG